MNSKEKFCHSDCVKLLLTAVPYSTLLFSSLIIYLSDNVYLIINTVMKFVEFFVSLTLNFIYRLVLKLF
jgi:hypothetical protein